MIREARRLKRKLPCLGATLIALLMGLVSIAHAWPPNPRPVIPQRRWEYDAGRLRRQQQIQRDIDRLRLRQRSRDLDRRIEKMKRRDRRESRGDAPQKALGNPPDPARPAPKPAAEGTKPRKAPDAVPQKLVKPSDDTDAPTAANAPPATQPKGDSSD